MKKSRFIAAVLAAVILLTAGFFALDYLIDPPSRLTVHFIDVGQGDAALLVCDGHAMLIDGGMVKAGKTVSAHLKDQGVSELELVIASHGDDDHVGGLPTVLEACKVNRLLCSTNSGDGRAYQKLAAAAAEQGLSVEVPKVGDSFSLGRAKVTVLSVSTIGEVTDNLSLVVRVDHGVNSFLFVGDCELEQEDALLLSDGDLSCDVLKVAHHGSRNSSSAGFLRATGARYAVISVGADNGYGHPSEETLYKLDCLHMETLRTDELGTIVFESNEKDITASWEDPAA